jgi:hypothetical protein
MILAPCRFLREADQVGADDMVMMADFTPAHPAKELRGYHGLVIHHCPKKA